MSSAHEEPRPARGQSRQIGGLPVWALGLIPLVLIAAGLVALLSVGGDTLGERRGLPAEDIAVERTVLRSGEIQLTLRNVGPDAARVAQVFVNDVYVDYTADGGEIDPRGARQMTLYYPWQEGSPLLVTLLTSTGATIEHQVEVAVETPSAGRDLYGLMIILGLYVGVIPVGLGMLFLPFLKHLRDYWVRAFMALTVGLLGFLAVDAYLEGTKVGETSAGAFGGVKLLFIGAAVAFFAMIALDRHLRDRRDRAEGADARGFQISLLIAIGIGLHNLGEGLAIGAAYAIGELALGAFLVFGFALHNTTEGLAIVAPLAKDRRPLFLRLVALGLIAGAPVILGAFIGASVYNPELATLLIGFGIGAIVQVIVQLVPAMRDRMGRVLTPVTIGGIFAGVGIMYATGLLIVA